jgi:hypothetical protein
MRFFRDASCWEILDHLITAFDEGLLPEPLLARGREFVGHSIRLLNGYMNYLKRTGSALPPALPDNH